MFDSVLNRGNVPKSRFGTGSIISVAVHLAIVGIVVYLTTRPPPIKEDVSEVKFFAAAPPPPPPPPPPPKKSSHVEHKVVKKPDAIIQPKEIPTEKPKETEPVKEDNSSESDDDGVEGGVEGGVVGGVVGGVIGGVVGGTVGGTGSGTDTVPFGAGMTPPQFDKAELQRAAVTREAREAGIHGMLIVKCAIMADGSVKNCRVIKTLPFVAEAMVAKLESTRITPVTFQGKPTSVDYVFNFNFQAK